MTLDYVIKWLWTTLYISYRSDFSRCRNIWPCTFHASCRSCTQPSQYDCNQQDYGDKKGMTYIFLVVLISTISGYIFGIMFA